MTTFLFKYFLCFFKNFVSSGSFETNQHFIILDGDGSRATLEAIEQAHLRLKMIKFPLHTSHALKPLDVTCI
jgi:hypothetical protein